MMTQQAHEDAQKKMTADAIWTVKIAQDTEVTAIELRGAQLKRCSMRCVICSGRSLTKHTHSNRMVTMQLQLVAQQQQQQMKQVMLQTTLLLLRILSLILSSS
jgi:hypothetical protein